MNNKELPTLDNTTSLAFDRTYLAYERTLMAWIRTATSLITFGFTLYKFFFYLRETEDVRIPEQIISPRTYGLIMIVIGVVTLLVATLQHRAAIRGMQKQYEVKQFSLATLVAGLMTLLGILAFAAAILRA